MSTERRTLVAKLEKLLSLQNSRGDWDQDLYQQIVDLEKSVSGLPDDEPELELKPPKKTR